MERQTGISKLMGFVKYSGDIYLRWVSRRSVRVRWAGGGAACTHEIAGSRSRDKTEDNADVLCTRLSLCRVSTRICIIR